MSVKTQDEQEIFTCDQCGKKATPGIGLPEGWWQVAVRGEARLKDQYKHFCSSKCADAFDRGASQ